ncbi:MAG: hypothetical protein SFW09_18800 [Hyphomicrobiaceae bacterium]|nr:hypothetical protein [Hyphomicrobiaceae bacterium]
MHQRTEKRLVEATSKPHAAAPLRRRALAWLAALVLATGLGASHGAEAQVLANGNMEEGSNGAVTGWVAFRWEGHGTIETTRAAAFEGQQSVVINGHGVAKQAIYQQHRLKTCTYRLTGAAAAYGAAPNAYRLSGALHLVLGNGQTQTHNLLTGDSDWRRFELIFSVEAESNVVIYVFNYGSGRIFIDDVKLEAMANCAKSPDKFTVAQTFAKPLDFVPPVMPEDRVLAGYCERRDFADRPVCRRLAAAPQPVRQTSRSGRKAPLSLADFEQLNPFDAGTRLSSAAITGARSGVVPSGSYMVARSERGLPGDWSGYDWLRFDAVNPTATPQQINVEIWDDKTTGYWERVNWYTFVPPGRSTIEVPLQTHVGEKSVIGERRRLDVENIRRIALSQTKVDITVDNFRLEADAPLTTPFPELIALDAGNGGSPIMTAFTPFTAASVYRPERGWGIIPGSAVARSEDRRHPDNLYRDWISFTGGGLQFELPNGDYTIWMMLEDPGYWNYYPSWRSRSILVQEREVLTERPDYEEFAARYFHHANDEDLPGDDIWRRYVETRYKPKIFQARVTDGQLVVRFRSDGDPYANALSAMVIYPTAMAARGEAFLADIAKRREAQFNSEYRQQLPPESQHALPPANALGGKLWVFRRAVTTPIYASDKPGERELVTSLDARLAHGHYEPLSLGLHVTEDIDLTGAKLTLPGVDTVPWLVRHRAQRQTYDGSIYMSVPRLLDPLEISAKTPITLKGGQSRQLWFDLKAQDTITGGVVEGQLRLEFAGGLVQTLPVKVEIYPWTLPEPDIPIGYLGVATTYPATRYPEVNARREREMQASVELLSQWGMNAASGGLSGLRFTSYRDGRPLIDFTDADKSMKAIRGRFTGEVLTYAGFQLEGAILPYLPIETRNTLARPYPIVMKDVLDRIAEHGQKHDWLPLRHVVGDEPQGESIKNSIAVARAMKAARPDARTAVFTSFTRVDAPTSALAGPVDRLYLAGHSEAALAHIVRAGSECSLYNRPTRFERGIYLYKLRRIGCRGHMQFAYSSVHGDPWYGLDGREDEFVGVFAHPDGRLRPAMDFALYRVAVDDYRTVLALEQAVAQAPDSLARKAAQSWLADVERRTSIGHEAARPWADEELDGVRIAASRHLVALGYRGAEAAAAARAGR